MPRPDAIEIPAEEKIQIKGQILQGLRQRYLRHKAEMLSCEANGKAEETAHWKKQMDETVKAYVSVEADL